MRSAVFSGKALWKARKDSSSVSKAMTQEWAMVPSTGMPSCWPARTLEVERHPPIKQALAASTAACGPWALLLPKSTTSLPLAASTTLTALEAIRVWKFLVTKEVLVDVFEGGVTPYVLYGLPGETQVCEIMQGLFQSGGNEERTVFGQPPDK